MERGRPPKGRPLFILKESGIGMKINFIIITVLVLSVSGVRAQNKTPSVRAEADIFNEIMQTLPPNAKATIDSIHTLIQKQKIQTAKKDLMQKRGGAPACSTGNAAGAAEVSTNQAAMLQNLPEELREKIEKTIQEIDKERQKRELQFKDRPAN